MKAIILSAGQGRRLLPLTADSPKCVLPVAGRPLITWQVENLLAAGVDEIVVVVGYQAAKVRDALQSFGSKVRTVYNPFHGVSDNLASCWMARSEMEGDFLLINGDTLFETRIPEKLMKSTRDITVTVDRKPVYDGDDMKVHTRGDHLLRIGKKLPPEQSDAEAIGMICFREAGGRRFVKALNEVIETPQALRQWYLSVVDRIADEGIVSICSIEGMRWGEVDTAEDLKTASAVMAPVKDQDAPRARSANVE